MVQKGKFKKPREMKTCLECGRPFDVIITSHKKFCGRTCSGKVAIKLATNSSVNKRKQVHKKIKEYIIQWAKDNKELVLGTPYNKIKTTIRPLTDDIERQYGIKDIRVISKAVLGEDLGRKELLRFMKGICDEKLC
ncbi:hypothetical protein [Pseudalkalibacillus salsuginis]|uniref:hypothetical protein n=1 Tax=Pseudalkalibacillus salsuginis TaxID=2910972 RepID=UPI001F439A6C|nr:hypothetical protein [Pseudalkalibacillus salsuginis]MCF6408417.1 hypothetical protein [Pseudalkalibacillus salsuginis]